MLTANIFFDLNAGVSYNLISDKKAFFAGLSVYNILQHEENVTGDEFRLPTRFNFQAGAQFFLREKDKVYMSLTTMLQGKATEITLGGAYGLLLSEVGRNELIGGAWYRYKDAVIPYIGYQSDNFQFGFSYDFTVSSLSNGGIKNAYEMTLLFRATDKRELKTHISWY